MSDFSPKSDFLRVLTGRGFIHQCSDYAGVDDLARAGGLVAYIGFDCTAPSLHVGSMLQIMMLRWLQKTGAGTPLPLMGGGTTRVGDPSGKDESRKLLTAAEEFAFRLVSRDRLNAGSLTGAVLLGGEAQWSGGDPREEDALAAAARRRGAREVLIEGGRLRLLLLPARQAAARAPFASKPS